MIVLSVVALAVSAHAANTWYVDSGVSSSGNGQSWATAWKALSNIGGVSAGDTVYISGGPTGSSRAYSVSAWSPIGGSSSSPITYQIGQDSGASGHNGTAIFSGSGGFFGASPNNIIFSGDAGDNQMHFQFSGYSFVLGGTGAVNASNFRFSYVNLGTMNVTWDCFFFGTTTKIEVDHVYLYMTGANSWQCFELDLPSGTTWDDSKLHNLTLYVPSAGINQGMGVDGIYFGGNGVSVYSNFICGCSSAGYSGGQHGDGVQCVWGQYNKVYDNVIANMPNFGIYFEALMSDLENLQIYNNIVVNCTGGIIVGSEADATSWISSCTVANILIANNIVDATGNDQDISFGDLGSVPVVTYSNNELANNVVINGPYGIWLQNASPTMMNNVSLNSSQASSDYISFTASGTNNNYHLTASATALIGKGANLSGSFTTDKDGNARPAGTAAWDIGPYQYGVASTNVAPSILTQPSSLTVGVGSNATFMVTTAGTAPLAYQWRFNSGILSSATGSAYTITSATTNNAGTYTVIVTNSYGSAASSAAVLTVTNSLATNVPLPFIALTAPANSARYAAPATINLAATVTANGHTITKVQFYNGAALLAAATAAPYSFAWTNVSAGSYSLTARAVYDSGSTVASTAATVTVTNVTLLSIALTAPVNGASYAAPATINLAATVTANGHTITNVQSVQFYTSQDGWLATCISAPYTFTWTGVVAGSYSVTALVVDDSGNMVYSTAANVTVTNVPLPSIVLTSPVSGASYTLPATIPLAASVTANGYSITQVQFYNGATLLGAVVAAPYSFSWTNVIAGSYAVTARAVYNSGSTVSSAEANVTVAAAGRPAELTFAADSGTFSAPFVDSNGTLSQSVTTGVTNGGQAVYTFNIVNAGNYLVSAMVIAPSLSQNSFYVNIDAEPTDPLMIWDIPVCTNLTSRTVSWRGNGNSDPASSQYIPEVFTLSAGKHQLIIVGREADTTLGTISIAATPPTLKISSASGTAGLVQPGQPSPTLSATGQPGQTYNVLSSQDFVTWIFIGTVTLDASGSGQFTDPAGSTSRPICVYRLQGQ